MCKTERAAPFLVMTREVGFDMLFNVTKGQ